MIYVKNWLTSVSLFHKPCFRYRFANKVLSMSYSVSHKLSYLLTYCHVVVHLSEMTVTIVTVTLACHGRFISYCVWSDWWCKDAETNFPMSLIQFALLSGNWLLQINKKKSNNTVEKWSRDMNEKVIGEEIQMSNKCIMWCSTSYETFSCLSLVKYLNDWQHPK